MAVEMNFWFHPEQHQYCFFETNSKTSVVRTDMEKLVGQEKFTVQKKPPVLVHQLTSSVFDTTPDGNYPWNVLQSKVDELRATYGALVNLALRRYADEERFWPNNYQKHGEDQFNTLREAMGEFLYKQVPESFMTNPCAQLACMGIAIEGSSFVIAPEEDKGWAGPVLREKYLSHMHRELRTKILPAANKPYMACRTLIDACSEEGVTMLQVDDKVQQIM
eukprot:gene22054-28150_t